MNWKRFKNMLSVMKIDERQFILGIDIGNDSSAIAYYDVLQNNSEVIDISGGYGRPSIPTVIQYIFDTKEWVYGEYAILNRGIGKDVTMSSLVDKLGRHEYIEIDKKPVSVVSIMGLYLKEVISNVRNINPKAEIVGIIIAIPSYMGDDAREELIQAVKYAGYEKELIDLVSDRECVFTKHYHKEEVFGERVLLLDFGGRGMRGGIYDLTNAGGFVDIKSLSSLYDDSLGTDRITEAVTSLFTRYYCENTHVHPQRIKQQAKDQIAAFVYQHKDLLFQKNSFTKPIKLYFNFVYPPFQKSVSTEDVEELIGLFRTEFDLFIKKVLEKNLYDQKKINPAEINTVLCTGGGFEMAWVKKAISDMFPRGNVVFYKNAKCVTAEGAALLAAQILGVLPGKNFRVEDQHQIKIDIGIQITSNSRDKFIPIIEKNTFWWQSHKPKIVILNEPPDRDGLMFVDIFMRDEDGDTALIKQVPLTGLPHRPPGTTRLALDMHYRTYNELCLTISDRGFGEMFPKSDYSKTVYIDI